MLVLLADVLRHKEAPHLYICADDGRERSHGRDGSLSTRDLEDLETGTPKVGLVTVPGGEGGRFIISDTCPDRDFMIVFL